MARTQKSGDDQTQRLWPMGYNTQDARRLQDVVPDVLSDAVETGGEENQICSSPLSNGNIFVPHHSSRWGTKGNPLHNQRWISRKTSGGTSNRSQEGTSRPRTVGGGGGFQAVPLQRRANEVFLVSEVRAPQGHMPQPRVLCNLQRQTRDQCLYQQSQGGAQHNGTLCKLQREPPCAGPQMPRMSETDPDGTMPGHNNTAKKREGSYTKEAGNLHNCPLNLRINKNRLLCRNAKRSPEANPHSQATKGEEVTKGKKTFQDCGVAIKPHCRGKFPQGEERSSTSRQDEGEGESRNKENGFCTNTDISCAMTSKGDSNPQKGKKRAGNANFAYNEGRVLQSIRTSNCLYDADVRYYTGSATQQNAANRTGYLYTLIHK